MMDPFVSLRPRPRLATLTLATGICLVLEHDLLDLACTVATLDVLSGGRVLLGIGVGWNEEELPTTAPNCPSPSATRRCGSASPPAGGWTEEEPHYDGR